MYYSETEAVEDCKEKIDVSVQKEIDDYKDGHIFDDVELTSQHAISETIFKVSDISVDEIQRKDTAKQFL